MATQAGKAQLFLDLHVPGQPLLMANPWDRGTAMVLAAMGFNALATTSGGLAVSNGGLDGTVTRDQAIAHAAAVVTAVEVPVSADLEDCYANDPDDVAATAALAAATGLAGFSIEDTWRRGAGPVLPLNEAAARVRAAAEVAHGGEVRLVLTARAENHLHGIDDLGDTISRLLAYQNAGADVLYAPGLVQADDIAAVVAAVDLPVNVLALPNAPSVSELARLGVARVSVGSAFNLAAHGALARAARDLLAGEPVDWDLVADGRLAVRSALS